MSKQDPQDGERRRKTAHGTYEYELSDGTTVHGDASGESTLDERGEIDDIVFFASTGWQGHGPRKAAE